MLSQHRVCTVTDERETHFELWLNN